MFTIRMMPKRTREELDTLHTTKRPRFDILLSHGLPSELRLCIVDHLDVYNLYNVVLTCRLFEHIFNGHLQYRLDSAEERIKQYVKNKVKNTVMLFDIIRRGDIDNLDHLAYDCRKKIIPIICVNFKTIFAALSTYEHYDMMRILFRTHADVMSDKKHTWLHCASAVGDIRAMKILLDYEADINAKTEFDTTPLLHAVYSGKLEAVRLLVARGANVNAPDGVWGLSRPIHQAAIAGRLDIIEALAVKALAVDALAVDALDVNACRAIDGTALHIAIAEQHLDIVIYLAEQLHADVDSAGLDGQTPLHEAVRVNSPHMAWWLIKLGADIDNVDGYGRKAFDIPSSTKHRKCWRLLEEAARFLQAHGVDDIVSIV